MTKISHFPVSHGRYVSIKLRPVRPNALDEYPLSRIAILSPELDTDTPLIDINYEKDDFGNLVLEAKFKSSLNFKVMQQTNEIITIFLPKEDTSQEQVPGKDTSKIYYTINLQSTTEQKSSAILDKIYPLKNYKAYTTKTIIAGKTWYRLRVGFFTNKKQAYQVKQAIIKRFPSAWVSRVTGNEIRIAEEWYIDQEKLQHKITLSSPPPLAPRVTYPERATMSPTTGSRAEKLMEIARQAMVDGNYKKAIRYYSKVLELNTKTTRQDALEFLGVAREKNNQLAHAKAEYNKYLSLYPDTEGATRVKQRLTAILTARKDAREKLAKKQASSDDAEWKFHGSLSQFYRRQDISTNFTQDLNVDDSLNTDFALTGRYRGENFDIRTQVTTNNRYDFNAQDKPDESSVYSLYLDVNHKSSNISGRLGRQTHNGDGVLGRFDGLLLSFQVSNDWKINAVGGYPVELTRSNISDKEKVFYGLSVDTKSIENWEFTFYGISQSAYDIVDRQAVGLETQFRDKNTSFYTTLDYDTSYKELNNITVVGTMRFENQSSLNLHMDYRNSPFLTTNNALIGQTSTNIEELLIVFSEDEIRELALDRTARFKSITISGSVPLNSKYQINGDITASTLSSTPSSGGVPGTPSTGTEYYASAQLIANNYFSDNDTTIFSLRFGQAATSESSTFIISTRLVPNSKWRIYPRLTIDKRKSDNGTEKTTYKPLVKLDYRYKRNTKFRMELGYDNAIIKTNISEDEEKTKYIYAGYIYDF